MKENQWGDLAKPDRLGGGPDAGFLYLLPLVMPPFLSYPPSMSARSENSSRQGQFSADTTSTIVNLDRIVE
jgi:hypothetical protein